MYRESSGGRFGLGRSPEPAYQSAYQPVRSAGGLSSGGGQTPGTPTPEVISALRAGLSPEDLTDLRLFGQQKVVDAQNHAFSASGERLIARRLSEPEDKDSLLLGNVAIGEAHGRVGDRIS